MPGPRAVAPLDRVPAEVRSVRVWLLAFLVWTLLSALSATIRYAYYFQRQPIGWWNSFAFSLSDAYLWALLTPPLMGFGVLFRLDRETWPRLPLHLGVAMVVPLLYWFPSLAITRLLGRAVGHPSWGWEVTREEFVGAYLNNLIVCAQLLAVSQGLVHYRESRERALRASRLEAELARAQLQLLRMQLEPHFLFNTLNAVSTLLHGDPAGAERMIVLLSDLLRRALEERKGQEVALREELDFLDRYLQIEQIRFPDRLRVVREIQPESLDALVPTLVLHPLVENAIRHGLARRPEGGRVGIRARREDGRLQVCVWDDGPGWREAAFDEAGGARSAGIGLANTRARLEQLYGSTYRFEVRGRREGGVEVLLNVPFRMEPAPEPA
jgi:two-component system, LytTR family, sensor kinase